MQAISRMGQAVAGGSAIAMREQVTSVVPSVRAGNTASPRNRSSRTSVSSPKPTATPRLVKVPSPNQ